MSADNRTGLALAGSVVHREQGRPVRVAMPFEELAQSVGLAEATGYDVVWVPDHGVWEPFSLLASLAQRTAQVGLATGVVTVASRTPEEVAAATRTLNRVSARRAILGVGSGPEQRTERVADYVERVRRDIDEEKIPIYLAALGPRMVEVAGMIADGVLLNWCTPARVERAREELGRGAERAGRDPSQVEIAVYVRACLGHDEEHALAALRQAVGMYAGMPSYRRQLEGEGLGAEAAAAARAHEAEDPTGVPASLVGALCVWGDRDEALARLAAWREAGADLVVVYPVTAQEAASSLMGTIMAAAPDPAVEH